MSDVAFVMAFDQPVRPRSNELDFISGRLVQLEVNEQPALVVSQDDYQSLQDCANGRNLSNRYVQDDLLALREDDPGWSLVVYAFLIHEDIALEEVSFSVRDVTHSCSTVKNRVNLVFWKYYRGEGRQNLRIIEGDELAGLEWRDAKAAA